MSGILAKIGGEDLAHPAFKEFYTIKKEASFAFEEKKSRFIGYAKPVRTEEEAVEFISSVRKKYSDATHHCYAYYIHNENLTNSADDDHNVRNKECLKLKNDVHHYDIMNHDTMVQRFNDDGEPGGTAGMPILDVIRKNNIRNAMIVVTRYFGGIMLGAGGLVRAYSKAASEAVSAAGKAKVFICTEVKIITEYTLLGKLQNMFSNEHIEVKNIEYTQDVKIVVVIPESEYESLENKINEITNASVLMQKMDRYLSS